MTDSWQEARLGQDPTPYRLSRPGAMARAVALLAGQARRGLRVWTPDLEPRLYDTRDFLDAVKALALASRAAEIRFLVGDARRAMQLGHRLPELARQMSSAIAIRRIPPANADQPEAYLVVDRQGYLHRAVAEQGEAVLCFQDPLGATDLERAFDAVWECASPDPETRRLYL